MATLQHPLTLQQNKDVLLAAIDYLLENTTGRIKFDQVDPKENYYRQLKQRTENEYQKGRPEQIRKWLQEIIAMRTKSGDLNFGKYIKEKTGHDIDLFENLPARIDTIIRQKKIRNQTEYQDVMAMDSIWHQTPGDPAQMNKLQQLRKAFEDRMDTQRSKQKPEHHFSNSLYNSYSPDNTRMLHVVESGTDTTNATTQVSASVLKTGGGGLYSANGINLGIKAYWKNNNTIVIEEKKGTPVNTRWNQLQVFDHVIAVEYIQY